MQNIDLMLARAKVKVKKPDFNSLISQGFMVFDMHVHTRFSDCYTRVRRILKKAEKLGIGIAITDHNNINGVLRAFEINSNVPIIPGIEISTAEGPHVLVYFSDKDKLVRFYDKHVKYTKNKNPHSITRLSIHELVRVTKDLDCVVSLAHPFSPAYTNIPKHIQRGTISADILNTVDAIEALNGAVTKKMNQRAIKYAEDTQLGITGGSDSHSLFELGKIVTYSNARDIKSFLNDIRTRKTFVWGNVIGQVKRMPSVAKASQRHLKYFFNVIPQHYNEIIVKTTRYHKPIIVNKLKNITISSMETIKQPTTIPKKMKFVYKPLVIAYEGTRKIVKMRPRKK